MTNIELKNIKTNLLKNLFQPLRVSYSYYVKNNFDEDVNICNYLIKRYKNKQFVYPIVIDENNRLMDGLHRYVAQKYLHRKIVQAYKRSK